MMKDDWTQTRTGPLSWVVLDKGFISVTEMQIYSTLSSMEYKEQKDEGIYVLLYMFLLAVPTSKLYVHN